MTFVPVQLRTVFNPLSEHDLDKILLNIILYD